MNCPYCGSKNVEIYEGTPEAAKVCNDCNKWFDNIK